MLFTTSGILRCESLYKAELSNFIGLRMKKTTDVHSLYLLIMQIATGKTRIFPKYTKYIDLHRLTFAVLIFCYSYDCHNFYAQAKPTMGKSSIAMP